MKQIESNVKRGLAQLVRSTGLLPVAAAIRQWGASHNPFTWRQRRAETEAAASLYGTFVKPGDLCFDVGAHQGIRTDVFLKLGARVIAVEPQAGLASRLQRKYRSNDRVVVVPAGLDEKEGETTLYVCNYSTCSSMNPQWIDAVKDWERMRGRAWSDAQTVAVTTLDRLIERHGVPAFCKIDVEGFEWNVLRGLSRPVPSLSLEYNPRHLDVATRCVDHLQRLGQYEFNYSEGDSMQFSLPRWTGHEGITALIRDVLPSANVYGDIYARLRNHVRAGAPAAASS